MKRNPGEAESPGPADSLSRCVGSCGAGFGTFAARWFFEGDQPGKLSQTIVERIRRTARRFGSIDETPQDFENFHTVLPGCVAAIEKAHPARSFHFDEILDRSRLMVAVASGPLCPTPNAIFPSSLLSGTDLRRRSELFWFTGGAP